MNDTIDSPLRDWCPTPSIPEPLAPNFERDRITEFILSSGVENVALVERSRAARNIVNTLRAGIDACHLAPPRDFTGAPRAAQAAQSAPIGSRER